MINIFKEVAKTYEIIDFHTHPYSNNDENINSYVDTLAMTPADLAADMERCGISMWCGSVLNNTHEREAYNTDFSLTKNLNDQALMLGASDPRIIPGIHIHPAFVEESIAEIERAHKAGCRLVGELVPYSKGQWEYGDPRLAPIFERAGELGMVVSCHSAHHEQMDIMVAAHPHTNFVLAHPGEKDGYFKHLERMKKYDNVYLDLSGTGLFRYGMLAHGVREVGSERILFGSDYPVCSPAMNIGGILYEKLSDRDYENIFALNARRLLGL